jgi:hypothetical protein
MRPIFTAGHRLHIHDPIDGTSILWPFEDRELLTKFWIAARKTQRTISELWKMAVNVALEEIKAVVMRDGELLKQKLPPEELVELICRQFDVLVWLHQNHPSSKTEKALAEAQQCLWRLAKKTKGLRPRPRSAQVLELAKRVG